ncbi:MAG: hypothetical protein ACRDQZ_08755, partial [Mycobacteriales bacterium]
TGSLRSQCVLLGYVSDARDVILICEMRSAADLCSAVMDFSRLLPDPWAQETVARFERTAASMVSLVGLPVGEAWQGSGGSCVLRGRIRA